MSMMLDASKALELRECVALSLLDGIILLDGDPSLSV